MKKAQGEQRMKEGPIHRDCLLPDGYRKQQGKGGDEPRASTEDAPAQCVGEPGGGPQHEEIQPKQEIIRTITVGRLRIMLKERRTPGGRKEAQRRGDHQGVKRCVVEFRIRLGGIETPAARGEKGRALGKVDKRGEALAICQLPAHIGLQERQLGCGTMELFPGHHQGQDKYAGQQGCPPQPAGTRTRLEPVEQSLGIERGAHPKTSLARGVEFGPLRELAMERAATDAHEFGGLGAVAPGLQESLVKKTFFVFLHGKGRSLDRRRR